MCIDVVWGEGEADKVTEGEVDQVHHNIATIVQLGDVLARPSRI